MRHRSELVLLPEFAMVEPVWQDEHFDADRWAAAQAMSDAWLERLPELHAAHVVGARPASIGGRPFNQGYLWSRAGGARAAAPQVLPAERTGQLGSALVRPGRSGVPGVSGRRPLVRPQHLQRAVGGGDLRRVRRAGRAGDSLAPRDRGGHDGQWLSVGVVAAVRSGAFSLSSNRVDPTGACGGFGWIIAPDGQVLATTTPDAPFATMDIDLAASDAARAGYPCSLFRGQRIPFTGAESPARS